MNNRHASPATLLTPASAEAIPPAWSGLWFVRKLPLDNAVPSVYREQEVILPAGTYTYLFCMTEGTMLHDPPGALVMEDTPYELRTHLQFMLQAHGDVLVTGLGLGCVVRGLQANPNVRSITCIENSPDVLQLVQPYMPVDKLQIIEADALEWVVQNEDVFFDCAWHDLWTNKENGEPELDEWHARLLMYCQDTVKVQGAWGFPRSVKRFLQKKGMQLI
jgi:hypothetical protein